MTTKRLPIGISNFKELIESDSYFIDKVVMLDEYDSPIHVSYDRGYYQQIIDFIRTFMSTERKPKTEEDKGIRICCS